MALAGSQSSSPQILIGSISVTLRLGTIDREFGGGKSVAIMDSVGEVSATSIDS
jgi:hypothetical protein